MREGDDDFPERDFDNRQQRNQQDAGIDSIYNNIIMN